MISAEKHQRDVQLLEETHKKDKMDAIGSLELQWQEQVSQEKNMHMRVLEEKDLIIKDHKEALCVQKKEKEFLSEQLRVKTEELRELQSTLAAKEQTLAKLTAEVQKLRRHIEKDKDRTEQIMKETTLKIKESMDRKIHLMDKKLQETRDTLKQAEDRNEVREKVLDFCHSALRRQISPQVMSGLIEAFPDCGSLQWLEHCEECPALQTALREAQSEAEDLRNLLHTQQTCANAEMELITLLHKLYWVFRRSESRSIQLVVQKNYLQNCALRQLENFPQGKRTLKTVAIVIMAVYR